jgi:uncharacterized protein YndB with AHSA1/START domain
MTDHLSESSIEIAAPVEAVWHALLDKDSHGEMMFGSEIVTTWAVGEPIVYRGEWQGKPFEDHGVVVEVEEPRILRTTHFSPLSGEPDIPENYHEISWLIENLSTGARVTLTQSNNPTEESAKHSTENWDAVLKNLKKIVER